MQRLADKQRLSSLIKVSQDISSILNIDILMENLLSKAVSVIGAQNAYLFLKNETTGQLELKLSKNISSDTTSAYSQNVVEKVFNTGKHVLATNAMLDENLSSFYSIKIGDVKSLLCVPLKHFDNIIGVFYFDNRLSSGVFNEEDLEILKVFMAQASIALENAFLYETLEKKVKERTHELNKAYNELKQTHSALIEKDRIITEDLLMAKRIQTEVIGYPDKNIDNLDIDIFFNPMIEVGGDIFDIFKIKDNYYRVFIADATGHGVQAALATMIIKTEYDKIKNFKIPPDEVLFHFNNAFIKMYYNLTIFFTCAVIDLDLNNGNIIFTSAGHPDQYIIQKDDIFTLRAGGKMVGIKNDIEYEKREADFYPGCKLFLFTDGLYEVFNKDKKVYGESRLITALYNNKFKSSKEINEFFVEDIKKWRGPAKVNDDITIICIEYLK
jgi:sigma-B regulation protein RsbU (phosphoserine phosphatase)